MSPELYYSNRDLAEVFQTIADLLEIKGENIYKILAYRKAADSLNNLGRDVNQVWREGELNTIPGVGKAIAEKIDELLASGRLEFFEKLKSEVPVSLVELLQVPDLGPKKVALFWRELDITDLPGLEAAARGGKLRSLPGMGEKSEAKIIAGIEALSRRTDRIPLCKAWPAAQELLAYLRAVPGVTAAEAAGSLRRTRNSYPHAGLLDARFEQFVVAEKQYVEPGVVEAPDRLARVADDRLALDVERRIQDRILPGEIPERFDQLVVPLVDVLLDHLGPCRAVHVDDGGYSMLLR